MGGAGVNADYPVPTGVEFRCVRSTNRHLPFFGGNEFLKVYRRHGLSCSWSVEAGCHDGSDTLAMINSLNLEKVFAFEPDDIARAKAHTLLEPFLGKVVFLSPLGLSDVSGEAKLAKNVSFGDGSSQVLKDSKKTTSEMSLISLTRLDDFGIDKNSGGLLWLDVEGHAVQALTGGIKTLSSIDCAKIEIQMHAMSETRKADAFEVINICQSVGLVPVYLPVHPGFFGDIIFIRKTRLNAGYRFFGRFNFFIFSLLHKCIYPILSKPSNGK